MSEDSDIYRRRRHHQHYMEERMRRRRTRGVVSPGVTRGLSRVTGEYSQQPTAAESNPYIGNMFGFALAEDGDLDPNLIGLTGPYPAAILELNHVQRGSALQLSLVNQRVQVGASMLPHSSVPNRSHYTSTAPTQRAQHASSPSVCNDEHTSRDDRDKIPGTTSRPSPSKPTPPESRGQRAFEPSPAPLAPLSPLPQSRADRDLHKTRATHGRRHHSLKKEGLATDGRRSQGRSSPK